jgi:hypothetical protein
VRSRDLRRRLPNIDMLLQDLEFGKAISVGSDGVMVCWNNFLAVGG